MSQRAKAFSLLDLLVTLGFTLGTTAACLGVLAAVSHTGKRDGVLAELENDADVVVQQLGRDLGAAKATPQSRVATTANLLSLETAEEASLDADAPPPAAIVAVEREGETAVLHLDFGPGVVAGGTRQAFVGFVVDEKQKIPVQLVIEGSRAEGKVPPAVKAGAWLAALRIVHWRLADAVDVTSTCEPSAGCALYRLVDKAPPSTQPVDLAKNGLARASSAVRWEKIASGIQRFDADVAGNGAVTVSLEMVRPGRTGGAYTFSTQRSFLIGGGRP